MLITVVFVAKRERPYPGIGDFIILFGSHYNLRKGVILYGDEKVQYSRKDIKSGRKEGYKKENNKEIIKFLVLWKNW